MSLTRNDANKLSCIFLNCRSLNKLGAIKLMVYSNKPDVVVFSETWITKNIPSFYNYTSIWKHRKEGRGGGLGFLVKRGVQFTNLDLINYQQGVMEVQGICLYAGGGSKINILSIYNPNKSVTIDEMKHYTQQLGNKSIILGDFNAHTPLLSSGCSRSNPTGNMLENFISESCFCIVNPYNFYIHLNISTGCLACLDLCFASTSIVSDTKLTKLGNVGSDHLPIKLEFDVQQFRNELKVRRKWKINEKSFESFSNDIEPNKMVMSVDIENRVADFSNRVLAAASKNFAKTSGKIILRKSVIWWDDECSSKLKEVRKARKYLHKCPSDQSISAYKILLKEFNKIKGEKREKSFQKFISDIKHDTTPGEVWKKIKAIKGYVTSEYVPIYHEDRVVLESVDKANLFARHIADISNKHSQRSIKYFSDKYDRAVQDDGQEYNLNITLNELKDSIAESGNSASGEDDIPYAFLKAFSTETLQDLQDIYNQSFNTGVLPSSWRVGLVLPFLKPGKAKNELMSYRPITLLSCLGKTLEKIVKKRLEFFTESNKLLLDSQCGFRKGQGTIDVFLRLENEIRGAFNKHNTCLVAYIDLKSAFESIWREGLINKLIDN